MRPSSPDWEGTWVTELIENWAKGSLLGLFEGASPLQPGLPQQFFPSPITYLTFSWSFCNPIPPRSLSGFQTRLGPCRGPPGTSTLPGRQPPISKQRCTTLDLRNEAQMPKALAVSQHCFESPLRIQNGTGVSHPQEKTVTQSHRPLLGPYWERLLGPWYLSAP